MFHYCLEPLRAFFSQQPPNAALEVEHLVDFFIREVPGDVVRRQGFLEEFRQPVGGVGQAGPLVEVALGLEDAFAERSHVVGG